MVDDILELTQPPQQMTGSGNGHSAINPFLQPGPKSKPSGGGGYGRVVLLKHTFRHRRLLALHHDDHLHVDLNTNSHPNSQPALLTQSNTLHELLLTTKQQTRTEVTSLAAAETVNFEQEVSTAAVELIDNSKDSIPLNESIPTTTMANNYREKRFPPSSQWASDQVTTTSEAIYYPDGRTQQPETAASVSAETGQWSVDVPLSDQTEPAEEETAVLINTSSSSAGEEVTTATDTSTARKPPSQRWISPRSNGTFAGSQYLSQEQQLFVADTTPNGANLSSAAIVTATTSDCCNSRLPPQNPRSAVINSVVVQVNPPPPLLPVFYGQPNRIDEEPAMDEPYGGRTVPMRDRLEQQQSANDLMMNNWQQYYSHMLGGGSGGDRVQQDTQYGSFRAQTSHSSGLWSMIRYLRERLSRERRRHRRLVMRSLIALMQSTLERDDDDEKLLFSFLAASLRNRSESQLKVAPKVLNNSSSSNSRSVRSKPTVSVADSQTLNYQVLNDIYTTDSLHVLNSVNNIDDEFVINLLKEKANPVDPVSLSRKCMPF